MDRSVKDGEQEYSGNERTDLDHKPSERRNRKVMIEVKDSYLNRGDKQENSGNFRMYLDQILMNLFMQRL